MRGTFGAHLAETFISMQTTGGMNSWCFDESRFLIQWDADCSLNATCETEDVGKCKARSAAAPRRRGRDGEEGERGRADNAWQRRRKAFERERERVREGEAQGVLELRVWA